MLSEASAKNFWSVSRERGRNASVTSVNAVAQGRGRILNSTAVSDYIPFTYHNQPLKQETAWDGFQNVLGMKRTYLILKGSLKKRVTELEALCGLACHERPKLPKRIKEPRLSMFTFNSGRNGKGGSRGRVTKRSQPAL